MKTTVERLTYDPDPEKIADWNGYLAASYRQIQEMKRPPVVVQVIHGEHPMLWVASEREFSSVPAAGDWVREVSFRPNFVLAVIRDRRNGCVTRIEPKPAEAAA